MHIRSLGLLIVPVALVETLACRAAGAARCDGLMNPEKVHSLGRNETLSKVDDSGGSSLCLWEGAGGKGGFIVTLQTRDWFTAEDSSGAQESFDRKRKAYDEVVGTDPVPELGLEARITRQERAPMVMVRRRADIIYLMCGDCSRDQSIALAKLAAAP